MKWIGAAYLVWLGLRLIFGDAGGLSVATRAADVPAGAGTLFRHGFILQATNPKAYLYVMAILPQFIDMNSPMTPQMALIIPTSLIAEAIVLAGYAYIAGRMRRLTVGSRFVGIANRAAGVMLVTAGLLVAGFTVL